MSSAKVIENPEVPGLECFLPPPPPPPPPIISQNAMKEQEQLEPNVPDKSVINQNSDVISIPETTGFPTQPIPPVPYIMHPPMQTPSQLFDPNTPWWIPTEADTLDTYTQWFEASYKATANSVPPPPPKIMQTSQNKSKTKYFKRKSECIDPAQDAERVAAAQKELSNLMKPLKCDLCNAVMNSNLQAKLHYDGKPHQKKVSMFLNQSIKKKTEDGQVTSSSDWQQYCDICKTWFTSQTDATQHYVGKKHLRAAKGGPRTRPSKKGQNANQYNQIDPTGRFGIGVAFLNPSTVPSPPVPPSPVVEPVIMIPEPMSATLYTPPAYPTPLRCDLCGVSANRQDQLETHKRGAKHLKMLRINGLPVPETVTEIENVTTPSGPIDYSIYRTPSGQYYCAPCNLSVNSETMFAQHVESKKHKNQCNPKSPTNNPNAGVVAVKKPKLMKK